MNKTFRVLWIFYKKLLIPAFLFALLLSFVTFSFNKTSFGISFVLILPFLHYFIYEIRFPDEYIFYGNFGFSKINLWLITICIALAVNILCRII